MHLLTILSRKLIHIDELRLTLSDIQTRIQRFYTQRQKLAKTEEGENE